MLSRVALSSLNLIPFFLLPGELGPGTGHEWYSYGCDIFCCGPYYGCIDNWPSMIKPSLL